MGLDEFWESTPFETGVFIEARALAETDGYRREMFGAWYGAYYQRVKRIPPLASEMKKLDPKPERKASRAQTREEMMENVEAMMSVFGVVDKRKKAE